MVASDVLELADRLQPIGEEAVQQVVRRGIVFGCVFATLAIFLFVLTLVLSSKVYRAARKTEEGEMAAITALMVALLPSMFTAFAVLISMCSFGEAMAPLATLLKR